MTQQSDQRDREIARQQKQGVSKMPSPFSFKVVGVTFVAGYPGNLHRLSDAADLAHENGEPLTAILVRNPDNEYDANAIEVHVPAIGDDGMIGHVTRPIAARLAPELDADVVWQAEVNDVLIDPDHMDRPGISVRCKREED